MQPRRPRRAQQQFDELASILLGDVAALGERGIESRLTESFVRICFMTTTVSSDFHIVIPPEMRQSLALALAPGQSLQIIQYENRIELIPIHPMQNARGMLRGIDTQIEREGDRI